MAPLAQHSHLCLAFSPVRPPLPRLPQPPHYHSLDSPPTLKSKLTESTLLEIEELESKLVSSTLESITLEHLLVDVSAKDARLLVDTISSVTTLPARTTLNPIAILSTIVSDTVPLSLVFLGPTTTSTACLV
jgi:hypothetical protein